MSTLDCPHSFISTDIPLMCVCVCGRTKNESIHISTPLTRGETDRPHAFEPATACDLCLKSRDDPIHTISRDPHEPGAEVEPAALKKQEGGDHYKAMKIQPIEYIHANGIGYIEGNVIKYVSRWRSKGGIEDLKKAKHYVELLMELELRETGIN